MRLIGLTGGIATGKSTVASILRELGASVVDADQVAHEVTSAGMPAVAEIAALLGPQFVQADGSLDRPQLARVVFHDAAMRKTLNGIVHPRVRAAMEEACARLEREGAPVAILDVPLLLEARDRYSVDQVWLVYAPEELQMRRLMQRNSLSEAEALARIRAQMPIEEKRRRADVVIDNTGDIAQLRAQVVRLFRNVQGR
ncbi:MAG: dephospho-CoA kinase [Thermaerobacter sp.]|nr:dephospho-CoA kinase [Thermaerobacter sp.]